MRQGLRLLLPDLRLLRKLVLLICIAIGAPGSRAAAADDAAGSDDSVEDQLVNCAFFRSKRMGVPVYEEPELSSRVVAKLQLGEHVCHIGERGDFAILDWRKQPLVGTAHKSDPPKRAEGPELAYARLVDLWEDGGEPSIARSGKGYLRQAREQIGSAGGGLVPEDIYGPFRPLIDLFHPPTKCLAGEEICRKIEEEQRRREEEQGGQR